MKFMNVSGKTRGTLAALGLFCALFANVAKADVWVTIEPTSASSKGAYYMDSWLAFYIYQVNVFAYDTSDGNYGSNTNAMVSAVTYDPAALDPMSAQILGALATGVELSHIYYLVLDCPSGQGIPTTSTFFNLALGPGGCHVLEVASF
jgi:hypothetical protein